MDVFDHRFDPENCPSSNRQELRETTEEIEFNEERYMGDEYMGIEEDMLYLSGKDYLPFWSEGGQFQECVIPVEAGGDGPQLRAEEPIQSTVASTASPPLPPSPHISVNTQDSKNVEFQWTENEMSQLHKLPNKEYLMDSTEEVSAFSDFVSILIGYVYDVRMTCGDGSVESSWTIAKLSASLSWLEHFTDADQAISSGVRRILCYP